MPTLVADAILAVLVTAFMVAGTVGASSNDELPAHEPLGPLTFVLVGVAAIAVLLRRTRPLLALGIAVVAVTAYLLVGYTYGPILFSIAITTYSMASLLPISRSLPAWGITAASLTIPFAADSDWDNPLSALAQLTAWLSWSLTVWAIGTAVRVARRSATRSRAELVREQTYQERLRTAQDVHDTVGHGLAAISMQAGVALHVMDRSPARTKEILETIRQSSQEALDELRATLATFRSPDDDTDRSPLPGLDRLDALVQRISGKGIHVEVVRTGEPTRLLASVDQAAFRIVQESLTNVLRHANAATATVAVHYEPLELTLSISDNGRGPNGSVVVGQGLAGMRARAGAVGGSLHAGPGPAGGFVVRASLPAAGQR